jgi:hypothetical protein
MVYMKLQPYAQTSVASRSNHKLSSKFFGPYEVLERIGNVAYRLSFPKEVRSIPSCTSPSSSNSSLLIR